jgi:hypothetical protein
MPHRWVVLEETPVYTIDEVHQQLKHHDELGNRRRPYVAVLSAPLGLALVLVLLLVLLIVLFLLFLAPIYGVANGVEQGYEMLVAGEG